MEPLDLTQHPPRSCYVKLDGLMVMPRTIDKLRALLPGGNPGVYFINGKIMGISGYLLKRLGISESDLSAVVASARTDDDVAVWLREHTDTSAYDAINGTLLHIEPRHAEDPSFFRELYEQTLSGHSDLTKIVDILDADDARIFNNDMQRSEPDYTRRSTGAAMDHEPSTPETIAPVPADSLAPDKPTTEAFAPAETVTPAEPTTEAFAPVESIAPNEPATETFAPATIAPAGPVAEASAPVEIVTSVEPTPAQPDPDETALRRKRAEEAWAALVAARSSRDVVEGVVKNAVKGGYIVALGPFRGFLPASQSRLGGTPTDKVAGKAIPLIVIDVDESKKRVVVSHRQALDAARRAARGKLLASLTIGSVHPATVVRLADFGAFVDLGGIDALVPIGELAIERIEKPADCVKVGDRFDVRVIRADAGGKRIAVSRKALLADPWRDHAALLQRSKIVDGKVVANATELQIEIAPGIVGTVSENEATPADYEIGESVEVTIRSVDFQRRRLRLSTMHGAQSFASTSFAPLGDELKV